MGVEAARIGHELRPLCLKHLPDRLPGQLQMMMRLGVGDAFVREPGIQLIVALEPQTWREEALARKPDLVLDLAFLPARRRRAGNRLDEIMAAHLQEAAIVEAVLANKDRVHCRLPALRELPSGGRPSPPRRNGNRSFDEIEHIGEDHPVGWAWAPGYGRQPAPGTQKEAGALVEAWANTGAECPK
jgi:hypothetical protein